MIFLEKIYAAKHDYSSVSKEKEMRSILLLLTATLCIHFSFAQEEKKQKKQYFAVNLEADIFSLSASANLRLHPLFNPGFGLKRGRSYQISWTDMGLLWYREHVMWFAYNRFEISENLHLDIGARGGDITLIDHNPREGFRHLDFIGAYIHPMVGFENLKAGPMVTLGHSWGLTTTMIPVVVRYSFRF